MEVALLVAFIAVGITAVSSLIDFIQTHHIRKVQRQLSEVSGIWKDNGTVGEQFGDYLMEKVKLEDGREISNLQIMAAQVGQVIASSFKMGIQGLASGEARRFRAIENGLSQVMEGDMSTDQKAVITLAKRVGEAVGFDVSASEVAVVVEKLGLNQIFKNNGSSGGGNNGTWGR